jgi:carboxymethylenebutenolidase
VLVWPDIFGLRPAFRQMGQRLAETGYSVLVVTPFYRTQKAPTAAKGAATPIPELLPLAKTLSPTTHMTDAKTFTAWLDQQASVAKNRKMGTQGYCMGGPMAFRTAAASDRVGAVASFHGGGLVTMDADSPHLLASKTKVSLLVAIASNDDKQRPMEKDVLKETFSKSGQSAEVEVYSGAHGWCPPDSGVYNEPDAEKAWARLLALYGKALALENHERRVADSPLPALSFSSVLNELPRGNCCAKSSRNDFNVVATADGCAPARMSVTRFAVCPTRTR